MQFFVNLNLFLPIFLGPVSFLIREKKVYRKKLLFLPRDVPQVQL